MSELADPHLAEALLALGGSSVAISDAVAHVPNQRGLYAIHASKEVWAELGVPLRDVPLYVGKAERSLVSRDLRTHFETGKTGSSTLRRSLAALLCDSLDLVAVPRNLATPSHFSNFALEWDGDAHLTEWMREKLTIAVWAAPASASELVKIERVVLARWEPPLNLKDVPHPSQQLKAARAKMADQARASARTPTSPASPTQSDVIQFIARYFEEDEAVATRRLRRWRYGWEVDTQPMTGELLLGPGPVIVDGRTGDYWETSSSPTDVFGGSGTLGWSELKSRSLFEKWRSEHPGPDGNVFTERHR